MRLIDLLHGYFFLQYLYIYITFQCRVKNVALSVDVKCIYLMNYCDKWGLIRNLNKDLLHPNIHTKEMLFPGRAPVTYPK